MNHKRIIGIFLFLLLEQAAWSQVQEKILLDDRYFTTYYGKHSYYVKVDTSEQNEPLNGKYTVYNLDDEKVAQATFLKNRPHGRFTGYYLQGNAKIVGLYQKGKRAGEWTGYFPNGKQAVLWRYKDPDGEDYDDIIPDGNRYVVHVWDSTGNMLVQDGKGNLEDYPITPSLRLTGTYENGLRNGMWREQDLRTDDIHFDTFNQGKFVKGYTEAANGKKTKYSQFFVRIAPPGGFQGFYQFLASEIKYPELARKMGVEGKVYLGMQINKEGEKKDIVVVRGIGSGCDEEAVRATQKAPAWVPAKRRGKPVEQSIVIPVVFKLK